MGQYDLFDEVAAIGREFLALSKSEQELRRYTWQLGAICDLIKHTHSIVVEKLEEIEAAQTVADARAAAVQLEDQPLTASFRANGLCDIFQGFGHSLRRIVEPHAQPGESVQPVPLGTAQINSWTWFCESLEEREQRVASLYASELREICNLSASASGDADLAQLKAKARATKNLLTTQMADFDALATQFRQLT